MQNRKIPNPRGYAGPYPERGRQTKHSLGFYSDVWEAAVNEANQKNTSVSRVLDILLRKYLLEKEKGGEACEK